MMPRLRDAIERCGHDEPFLLEIGAGPGAAAAILSAALDVRVVTVDAHPKSLGLPEQFAELTGGRVESGLETLRIWLRFLTVPGPLRRLRSWYLPTHSAACAHGEVI